MLSESFFVHENYLRVLDLDDALALEELARDRDGLADQGATTFAKSLDGQAHVEEQRAPMVGLSKTAKQQCRQARRDLLCRKLSTTSSDLP